MCDPLPFGCLFLLIVVGEGVVTCGSETEGWIPGVAKTVRCTGAGSLPNIDPALPEGMVLTGYAVNGSPKYPFTRNVFTITSGEDTGYLYISCKRFSLSSYGLANWKLTKLECGVQTQVIYKDLAFTPIHCAPDSAVNSFSIQPNLPSGLSFNEETGTLSGVYTGEPQKVTYTITATYNETSVSQTVTLDYRCTHYARWCEF